MKILVADLTDVRINLRPKRHIDFLVEEGHEVDVLSLAPPGQEIERGLRYIQIPHWPRSIASRDWWVRFMSSKILPPGHKWGEGGLAYRKAILGDSAIEETTYDLCLVERLELLPALLELDSIKKIIIDLREYHPGQNEPSLFWRLLRKPEVKRIYRHHLPLVDGVITVSRGIQNRLLTEWGVSSFVALSAPNEEPISKSSDPSRPLKLVHHGVAAKQRSLEFIVDAIGGLPSVTLTFYLVGHAKNIENLVRRARRYPNIEFRAAVHPTKIVESMSEFDIGVIFYPLNNFNFVAAMPNKFFEYITAGIPPLVSSGTDMASFVKQSSFGFTTKYSSAKDLRAFIDSIEPEDIIMQRSFLADAQERISPKRQKAVLISLVDDVTNKDVPN
jgi:glycosyltransferase involved in cell wall biosynthesis